MTEGYPEEMPPPDAVGKRPTEKVKIRGLAVISAWMFGVWGAVVVAKGSYDLIWGSPEANLYAPEPWGFITREQWLRYGGFEFAYGLACLALTWFLVRYSRHLPETVSRPMED